MSAAEAIPLEDIERPIAANDATTNEAPGFRLLGVADIFAPLPPVPWLVQKLDICPGAPTLLAGYGFSGKTMAAQSLALTVAGGGRVWGDFHCSRRGRVVHLDYEQGYRITAERYQRLAVGAGLDADALEGSLDVAPLPSQKLDSPNAFDALLRVADGAALVIVDSLRASAPTLDENSSEIRSVLDMLTLVSERTGAVALVIHHARKPSGDHEGGARMAIRGSSGIYDACASVLVFVGEKGAPTMVHHEKARTSGILADSFALRVEDSGDSTGGQSGLRVVTVDHIRQAANESASKQAELDEAVFEVVSREPGCNVRFVRGNVPLGKYADRDAALERLKGAKRIEERSGARGARQFYPSTVHRAPTVHRPCTV